MHLEAEGVSKHFGRVRALSDVSFEVASGGRVALIGPNGSGKSTLNRALMGLVRCEGRIRLDGVSPLADRVEVARRMAYVPQTAPALGAGAGELVRALCAVRDLDPAEVEKVARHLDLDLQQIASRPFRVLSGGMKQKLLIAIALATQATFFVLDEPTGSLDARSRARFFSLLDARAAGTTLLLCSHRLDEVAPFVDRVIQLEEGCLRYDGPLAGAAGRAE